MKGCQNFHPMDSSPYGHFTSWKVRFIDISPRGNFVPWTFLQAGIYVIQRKFTQGQTRPSRHFAAHNFTIHAHFVHDTHLRDMLTHGHWVQWHFIPNSTRPTIISMFQIFALYVSVLGHLAPWHFTESTYRHSGITPNYSARHRHFPPFGFGPWTFRC